MLHQFGCNLLLRILMSSLTYSENRQPFEYEMLFYFQRNTFRSYGQIIDNYLKDKDT